MSFYIQPKVKKFFSSVTFTGLHHATSSFYSPWQEPKSGTEELRESINEAEEFTYDRAFIDPDVLQSDGTDS